MIDIEQIVRPSSRAACCELTDEVVILDLPSGVYYGLEGVGATIWRVIQEPKAVREIVDHLVAEYEVSRDQCQASVVTFLEEMARLGLIATDQYAAA